MKRIKVMAPSRSLEMTRYQCDAGADELYIGLDGREIDPCYVNFTFNGRYNVINNVPCQVRTGQELQRIVEYAHSRDVKVNYTANIHYLSESFADEFDRYLDTGIAAGVDYLIVSNVGLIRYIRKRGVTLPIVAGVFLVTPNVEQVRLLSDFGVSRVVLPQAITFSELEQFTHIDGMEIEIFGHFGGGNNCGRCMLLHSPTIVDIGPGCRAAYDVYVGDRLHSTQNYFLDAAADCSLCHLPLLMDIGVDVIKIVGRESGNSFINSKITEMYCLVQDYILQDMSMSEIKHKLHEEQLVWTSLWKPRFCKSKRCKFGRTPITDSYIL
jgi:putative protease